MPHILSLRFMRGEMKAYKWHKHDIVEVLHRLSVKHRRNVVLIDECIKNIYREHPSRLAACAPCRQKSTNTTEDPDLLHSSVVPTDHFQPSLPRLPIPKLEQTCQRYLTCVKQIITPEEYAHTEKAVNEFKTGDGMNLHNELLTHDKENKHTSYISGPWFDMYLKSRLPIVLNFNPFMTFTDDPRPEYQDQLVRATNMVVSSLRFLKTLRAGVLEPDVYHLNPKKSDTQQFRKFVKMLPKSLSWYGAYWYKAFPLDMSQYGRLFNSTRIPRFERDDLFTDESARHILVMRNGNFYIFDVFDKNGKIVSPDVILSHLKYIKNDNRPPPEYPIGVLTAQERDHWATLREQLLNAGNELNIKLIDSAVFCLILDDVTPTDANTVTRQFLHGDGVNRWYDKSFQLILTPDAKACVNFEHAWGDGVAVLRYFNEVFKDSTTNSAVHPSTQPASVDSSNVVQCLDIKLDPYLKDNIKKGKETFDKTMATLDLHHLEYQKYTKKYVKAQKFSPDSLMQLAIQMAYYRQYGKTVATYESCSTAAFKHGRTETIRPATEATKKCCEMFVNKGINCTVAELRQALDQCSQRHNELTKEAAMGHGFDRHLFALRHLAHCLGITPNIFRDPTYHKLCHNILSTSTISSPAKLRGGFAPVVQDGYGISQGFDRHLFALHHLAQSRDDIPEIFKDSTYHKVNHNILSTSTISSPAVLIGGFAPVVPDGYGVGYSIEDGRIGFNVTSYPPATNVSQFIKCVEHSLDDIYEVFEGRQPKKVS